MDKKSKFRSRKLDYNKALQVLRDYEIADIEEAVTDCRSIPLVASGVDKEEEDEHHLQAAINASQAKTQPVYIPTPDASELIADYESFYKPNFKPQKSLMNTLAPIEECIEPAGVWYCIDDEDAAWLEEHPEVNEMQMESLFSKLEFVSNEIGFGNVNESYLVNFEHLNISMELMKDIFKYWQFRRMKYNGTIRPRLKFEDVTRTIDHYVCFRRREIKLQHRKTRRSDTLCLEKLRRLRSDFESVRTLIEMITKRDKFKKESFILDGLIFDQARLLDKWNTKFGIPIKLGAIMRSMSNSYYSTKLRKRGSEFSEIGNGFGDEMRGKKLSIIEQFSNSDELLHKDVNRCQISREVMKSLKSDLERRMLLDRDFEDNTLDGADCEEHRFFTRQNDLLIRYRLGRGGRIIQDRKLIIEPSREAKFFPISFRYLSAPELAICNNAHIQNYNQHYMNATSHLIKPLINYAAVSASTPSISIAMNSNGSSVKKKKKIKRDDEGD